MVAALGLPHLVPRGSSTEGILSRLKVDKKKSGEKVNFVAPQEAWHAFHQRGVSERSYPGGNRGNEKMVTLRVPKRGRA